MLLPEGKEEIIQPENTASSSDNGKSMEVLLEETLRQIDGAGEVSVLLAEQKGSQTIYQTDTQSDTDADRTSGHTEAVIITDSERNEKGLVQREDPPVYMGAIVVCQGADRADVRLAIVNAVQCVTGLGANQISVVKMK
jgi:stage III sporulation protein AG